MARVFKQIDYWNLVSFLYKTACYNQQKAITLYKYTAYQLLKEGFNEIYLDKLAYDLNLISDNETENEEEISIFISEREYKNTMKNLNNQLSYYELVNFKSSLWDIIHKGYYD